MAHFQATASRSYLYLLLRASRLRRLTLLLTAMALLTGARTAQAQDGRTIMLKSMRFYHSFKSYLGQANIDTFMLAQSGKTVKHLGAMTSLKLQRPNKIYVHIENPAGSRTIYSDGLHVSLYEAAPDQYITVPTSGTQQDMLRLMRVHGHVIAGYDTLFFLTQTTLPKELSDIKFKEASTCNGHQVYVVTGTTTAASALNKSGKNLPAVPASYWTWWIDRNSYLLYKVETVTPNIVRSVSFDSGEKQINKDVRGTLITRYTVSEIKMDANISPSDFVFTPPKTAMRRRTVEEVLHDPGR